MNHKLCCLLISVVLLSCTKTIDLDDQALANQAIVNCILWPDQPFSAYLTLSSSILMENVHNPPMQGTLDLYEDGMLIRQFPSQLGEFSATDIQPKSGKKYRVVVTANGRQILAETTIPYPAKVIRVDTVTVNHSNNYKTTQYSIKVKDLPGEDYYRIVVMNETLVQGKDPEHEKRIRYYFTRNQKSIYSADTIFKTVYKSFESTLHSHGGPKNDYFIFPDTHFQGKELTIQLHAVTYWNGNTDSSSYGETGDPIVKRIYERNVVHVQHLSRELYLYLKYLELYDNFYEIPFSEPVTVYSNVQNGAGIFAGFNDDARVSFETIYIPFSMDTIVIEDSPFYESQ